ncbi:MAG: hypothetical protein KDC38_13970 [Planctomycetes bacterium]|nr:hypothetical protein [Planctomycetota bacterium]
MTAALVWITGQPPPDRGVRRLTELAIATGAVLVATAMGQVHIVSGH